MFHLDTSGTSAAIHVAQLTLVAATELGRVVFFNHGFGGPVLNGEIQDVRPWGGSEAFSKNAKRSPTHVGIMLHILKNYISWHDDVMHT